MVNQRMRGLHHTVISNYQLFQIHSCDCYLSVTSRCVASQFIIG